MSKIREILLTEYIGAILVALLIANSFFTLVTMLLQQISYYSYLAHHDWPETPYQSSHRNEVLTEVVRILLYLISAYLLARWLYRPGIAPSQNRALPHQNAPAADEK